MEYIKYHMNDDNYLSWTEQRKAKYDEWWWMYFMDMYDTLSIKYPSRIDDVLRKKLKT